ncbi:MAG: hypothetical protein ACE15B_01445 [Bryobacteraceae bacterium]
MPRGWVLCAAALAASTVFAQTDELAVYTEHPRLFLKPARLRLLKRDRERQAPRWVQFEALAAGGARMPEPGFAGALFYRISGDQAAGRRAVTWALGPGRDLRQLAIVFDWCQELLDEPGSRALAARLQAAMEQSERDTSPAAVRSRVLAAIALAGHSPKTSTAALERSVRGWWQRGIAPALKAGRDPLPRDQYYALFEMLHAVRDNLNIDLRDSAPAYFKELPVYHLMAYYPASYPAGENEYRIQAFTRPGAPDLVAAALARAADLAMVAYDLNSPGGQVLQGFLMNERFVLRGAFGAPYELLWANPYQPGLSYFHVPLVFHDPVYGHLFARSDWEESAVWLGVFDGAVQLFQDGKVVPVRLASGPLSVKEAVAFFGTKFRAELKTEEAAFALGLKPRTVYQVEVDDEEVTEQAADPGGILRLDLPHDREVGVRLRETAR